MKTIRESFEDWYSDGGVYPNAIKLRTAGGEYLLAQAATSWNVWQAAHSSRDEEVQRLQEQVKLLREALQKAHEGLDSAARYFDKLDSQTVVEAVEEALQTVSTTLEATKEGG